MLCLEMWEMYLPALNYLTADLSQSGKTQFFDGKIIYYFTFDCSFQYYEQAVKQWVKEQGEGTVIDYKLVKINNNKSHSFYTVSSMKDFSRMLDTEWAREWDMANNCKDIVYKLQ